MSDAKAPDPGRPADRPVILTPTQARAGVISGRIVTVLIASMILAILAMFIVLSFFIGARPNID